MTVDGGVNMLGQDGAGWGGGGWEVRSLRECVMRDDPT